MLTQEKLSKEMRYEADEGVLYWTSPGQGRTVGNQVGSKNCTGYLNTTFKGKAYLNHRLIWLLHYGYMPENDIDHIDRNPLNNKMENLREVSKSCNLRNSKVSVSNTSGVKGVGFHIASDSWCAYIRANGEQIHLGTFSCFTEAVCHRLAAEQALDWHICEADSTAYMYVKDNIGKQ